MNGAMAKSTFLSVVEACDNFPFGPVDEKYYRLHLPEDDQPHGYLLPETVEKMPWTDDFEISHGARSVSVRDRTKCQNPAASVNAAFARLVSLCIEQDTFHVLCRKHSEPFAIVSANYSEPVFIERFAAQLFGIIHRGAHLVAYSNTNVGDMRIWIARRSAHLYTYPSMLDVTVAGGVKCDASPSQTLIEEADEEAWLPADVISTGLRSCGIISHISVTGIGFPGEQGLVIPDYIYTYDIKLPADVVPKPHDDEVSGFYHMSIEEVKHALLQSEFKPDSAAVLVDFLVRHSLLTPDNEPDFAEISLRLRRRLPFRIGG